MGMPTHELVADPGEDLRERELPLLFRDRGLHRDMEKEVAELLCQVRGVLPPERVENLVGLLEETLPERAVGLFPVPGTLPAESPRDRDKTAEFFRR